MIVDFIENAMANAPEKAKMYAGNQWKRWTLHTSLCRIAHRSVLKKRWFTFMRDNFEDEIQVTRRTMLTELRLTVRTITPFYRR